MSRLRGPQKSLICWGAFNDAEHQSLRPCYRTREQSDIVHAISLPNATSSVFATMLPNATLPNATLPNAENG